MRKQIIIFLLFIASAALMSCGSINNESAEGKSQSKADKESKAEDEKKGVNEGTPLALFIKDYVQKNPDFFNNSVIQKQKTVELDKLFDKAVANGILDNMVFTALSVQDYGKPEATFYFSVTDKDSTYDATVFVNGVVNDAIIAKFKDTEKYKLVGKIKTEKRLYEDMPNMRVDRKRLYMNDKMIEAPIFRHHGLKIDLKDIILVEN